MEIYLRRPSGSSPIVIDQFTSFRWRRRYYDIGEFELHITNNETNLSEATAEPEPIVWFKNSVERGIVESVSVSRDEIALSGRMEAKIMCKTVIPKIIANATAPELMKQAFAIIGGTVSNITSSDKIDLQRRWNALFDIEADIAKASNIGFYVYSNQLYLYSGKDKSIAQDKTESRPDTNPVVFIDEDLDSPVWTLDTTNYYDFSYVAGEGEGDSRTYYTVGTGNNQIYVDARDLTKGDQTTAEYKSQLEQRGIEKLAERVKTDCFEASISAGTQWKYKVDWNLGDVVTVQMSAWNQSKNVRITEVEEVWENGNHTIYPVFGDPLPEKITN